MTNRISSRILQLSTLITLCAHGVLLSQGSNAQPLTNHIWSVAGDTQGYSRENMHRTTNKNDLFLPQNGASDTEWENGWDLDIADDSDDVDTFFPLSTEDAKPAPRNNSKRPPQNPSSSTPERQPSILFSFEEQNDTSTNQLIEKDLSKGKFSDFGDDEWDTDPLPIKTHADISTAQRNASTVIHKENAPNPLEEIQEAPLEPAHTASQQSTTDTLGTKRVSVPPFVLPHEPPKTPSANHQTLSSKKSPYMKSGSQPKLGLFGPNQPQQLPQAKQQILPIAEKPQKEKSQITYSFHPEGIVAQMSDEKQPLPPSTGQLKTPPKTILINFNNVGIIEYLRFISRITNKNFVFDDADLQFNVTIISEEPTTLDNVMTALMQELRIHGLSLLEQDNSLLIHRNPEVRSISKINVEGLPSDSLKDSAIVTQVFRLNTLDPSRASGILRPMLSKQALIETAVETRHLIITDLVSNIQQVSILLKSIDSPNSGLVIGQYVVRHAFLDTLIQLAQKIMEPIAQDQTLTFVPHPAAKSIFIVSSPFIVERTISVLQHLDNFEGTTRIYDLEELKFSPLGTPIKAPTKAPSEVLPPGTPTEGAAPVERPSVPPVSTAAPGKWEITPEGNKVFQPSFKKDQPVSPSQLPQGDWLVDPNGIWYFVPEGTEPPFKRTSVFPGQLGVPGAGAEGEIEGLKRPRGTWLLNPNNLWMFQLSPGEEIEAVRRGAKTGEELPVGHLERTKFYIYKLQHRKGDEIVSALALIGESLKVRGDVNQDLAVAASSVQWLEASNSIIFTGTEATIDKIKELIEEIDRPLRQVYIEMLILETTVDDSLEYGVTWGTRSGGGSTATAQAFLGGASPVPGALSTGAIAQGETSTPDASSFISTAGYHLGMIGRRLTHNGTQFATLSALVTALHTRSNTNIVLSPKIITEDNKPAQIFVGINTSFQTQAVSNEQGSIITSNFEFRDVGTRMKVTPLIGASDIITMQIEQEVSRTIGASTAAGQGTTTTSPGPTTSINRTTTTVHVPDKHFVIISGMIDDEQIKSRNQFPCLGGIPILGAAFADQTKSDTKRNLMIFIRPQIIDTAEQFRTLTRRQQEVLKQKNRTKKSWKYEVDEALDFMNIKPPCCEECD